jgi:HSP20 family protein
MAREMAQPSTRKGQTMADVTKRQEERPSRPEVFDRFDRMFGDWMSSLPFRRAFESWDEGREHMIRVEEFEEEGQHVVRADLPGVDPDKDIEVTVSGQTLSISAERRQEEKTEEGGYVRSEVRYGTFRRSVPLPQGVSQSDVRATYKDGVLEVRVPVPTPEPAAKIEVVKS